MMAMAKPVILGERSSGGRRLFSKYLSRKVKMLYNSGFRDYGFRGSRTNRHDDPVGRSVGRSPASLLAKASAITSMKESRAKSPIFCAVSIGYSGVVPA